MAPELVCITWHVQGEATPHLAHVKDAEPILRGFFADPEFLIVGQNFPYDVGVFAAAFPDLLPLMVAACDADRVTDTKFREQILDIAYGRYRFERFEDGTKVARGYGLADMARRYIGLELDKETWRTGYGDLVHLPVEDWPEGARHYAKEDATATLRAYACQQELRHPGDGIDLLAVEFEVFRKFMAADLTSRWGLRTYGPAVERFALETQAAKAIVEEELIAAGLVRGDKTRSRDTKAAARHMVEVCKAQGLPIPRTKGAKAKALLGADLDDHEGVALDDDACRETGDPLLLAYAENTKLAALLAKDVPLLRSGATHPIHARFSLLETGRTSTSPNIQNPARKGDVRSCFRPRAGYVFAQADYGQLELCTLAQTCLDWFGRSRLAEVLNSGEDPHVHMGAAIGGLDLEEGKRLHAAKDKGFKELRQLAKAANFGFPGGLGGPAFQVYAKGYGAEISLDRAKGLKAMWVRQWPEMDPYFGKIRSLSRDGAITIQQSRPGMWRGKCRYTEASNFPFQSLGAFAAGRAWWLLTKANYVDRSSPLFGARNVNQIHDEFHQEVLESLAHEGAMELERLMVEGAREFLPDVVPSAPPLLMRFWHKDATEVWVDGRLVPWFGVCSVVVTGPGGKPKPCGSPLLEVEAHRAACQAAGHETPFPMSWR